MAIIGHLYEKLAVQKKDKNNPYKWIFVFGKIYF